MSLSARNRGFARSFGQELVDDDAGGDRPRRVEHDRAQLGAHHRGGVELVADDHARREPHPPVVDDGEGGVRRVDGEVAGLEAPRKPPPPLQVDGDLADARVGRPGPARAARPIGCRVKRAERGHEPGVALVRRGQGLEPRGQRAGLDRLGELADGVLALGRGDPPVRLGRGRPEPPGPEIHRVAQEGVGQQELALDGSLRRRRLGAAPERGRGRSAPARGRDLGLRGGPRARARRGRRRPDQGPRRARSGSARRIPAGPRPGAAGRRRGARDRTRAPCGARPPSVRRRRGRRGRAPRSRRARAPAAARRRARARGGRDQLSAPGFGGARWACREAWPARPRPTRSSAGGARRPRPGPCRRPGARAWRASGGSRCRPGPDPRRPGRA